MITLSLSQDQAQLILRALHSQAHEIYNEAAPTNDPDLLAEGDKCRDLANLVEESLISSESTSRMPL